MTFEEHIYATFLGVLAALIVFTATLLIVVHSFGWGADNVAFPVRFYVDEERTQDDLIELLNQAPK
jgi:hypothetical protein